MARRRKSERQKQPRPFKWQRGAVAVLDALGFKGIWNEETHHGEYQPCDVYERFRLVDRVALDARAFIRGRPEVRRSLDLRILFLSDTIVVACGDEDTQRALRQIANTLSLMLGAGVGDTYQGRRAKVPLAYRGAVTHGEYFIDGSGRFLLGPAVDRAAELHERAEGAFVWFDQPARDALGTWPADMQPCVTRWQVPVKHRGVSEQVDTMAVSPLWNTNNPDASGIG